MSWAKAEEEENEREGGSVDRPGGPYPCSLHGHHIDLKGKTWNPCKCDHQSWPWLGRPHMIKYNCIEPSPNSRWFWKSRKEGFKTNSQLFQRDERERKCALVRKKWILLNGEKDRDRRRFTSFKSGLVFTCTHGAGRLCWQIKYAGVQGQSRHTRMIDGSVWMLKSTEHEHVSAAQTRPSTQHLFKGQVLQNTLTVQLLPLSYQSPHWGGKKRGE